MSSSDNAAASARATYAEYTSAADPSLWQASATKHTFPPSLHNAPGGPSGVFPLDASAELSLPPPATSPNLLAAFIRVRGGDAVDTAAVATSSLVYVIRGAGASTTAATTLRWSEGDVLSFPGGAASHTSTAPDSALLWLCDSPLLTYLGVAPVAPRFTPALYPAATLRAELAAANAQSGASGRNRNGVLLGHVDLPGTRTITPTLWALYNLLPAKTVQPPHKHASVAVDYAVKASAGVYTLMAQHLDPAGRLQEPIVRADWVAGAVFTTPPNWWHSHHNESSEDAIVLPLQDAGLYTHMRTLSITFAK